MKKYDVGIIVFKDDEWERVDGLVKNETNINTLLDELKKVPPVPNAKYTDSSYEEEAYCLYFSVLRSAGIELYAYCIQEIEDKEK